MITSAHQLVHFSEPISTSALCQLWAYHALCWCHEHQHCVNRLHHQISWAYWYYLMLLWWCLLSYKAKDWPFLKFSNFIQLVLTLIFNWRAAFILIKSQWWTKQFCCKRWKMNQTDVFIIIESQWWFTFLGCMAHGHVSMCITLQRRWGSAPSVKLQSNEMARLADGLGRWRGRSTGFSGSLQLTHANLALKIQLLNSWCKIIVRLVS